MLRPTEKADMTDCTELLRLTPEERLLREYFPAPEAQKEARRRLADGEPLAYILGEWSFYGEVYTVTPDVLIPRSDTEILVERLIRDLPQNGRFLDLCTGSGCVAISVAAHRPDLTCVAVDISAAALDIARKNAARNGVTERIRFVRGDVLGDLPDAGDGFCAIAANPPYIDSAVVDTLSEQVRREPRLALDGGADGMDFYRAILSRHLSRLTPDGMLYFEIGYDQAEKITRLCAPRPCRILRDYGGNDRVAVISPFSENSEISE